MKNNLFILISDFNQLTYQTLALDGLNAQPSACIQKAKPIFFQTPPWSIFEFEWYDHDAT